MTDSSSLLRELHQRPVAYYPLYAEITGSIPAGVLLSQLMYWFSKKDKFFKTASDIQDETYLTEKQLRGAKTKIKSLDFITVTIEGLPAKTYYEIDWNAYEKSVQTTLDKRAELEPTKGRNTDVQKGQAITKSTAKNTAKKKETVKEKISSLKADSSSEGVPPKDDILSKHSANGLVLAKFLLERVAEAKGRKLTSTPTAKPIADLLKQGVTPKQVQDAILWLCKKYAEGALYIPEVQSASALRTKWDQVQTAIAKDNPPPKQQQEHAYKIYKAPQKLLPWAQKLWDECREIQVWREDDREFWDNAIHKARRLPQLNKLVTKHVAQLKGL